MKEVIIDGNKYELTDEEFDFLMCEQPKGKELKVVDAKDKYDNPIKKVVAVERVITEEEKKAQRIAELKSWFEIEYSYKEQKYRRLLALDKTDDDGIAAEIKLRDLYLEAEEKRKQIQELGG